MYGNLSNRNEKIELYKLGIDMTYKFDENNPIENITKTVSGMEGESLD